MYCGNDGCTGDRFLREVFHVLLKVTVVGTQWLGAEDKSDGEHAWSKQVSAVHINAYYPSQILYLVYKKGSRKLVNCKTIKPHIYI